MLDSNKNRSSDSSSSDTEEEHGSRRHRRKKHRHSHRKHSHKERRHKHRRHHHYSSSSSGSSEAMSSASTSSSSERDADMSPITQALSTDTDKKIQEELNIDPKKLRDQIKINLAAQEMTDSSDSVPGAPNNSPVSSNDDKELNSDELAVLLQDMVAGYESPDTGAEADDVQKAIKIEPLTDSEDSSITKGEEISESEKDESLPGSAKNPLNGVDEEGMRRNIHSLYSFLSDVNWQQIKNSVSSPKSFTGLAVVLGLAGVVGMAGVAFNNKEVIKSCFNAVMEPIKNTVQKVIGM